MMFSYSSSSSSSSHLKDNLCQLLHKRTVSSVFYFQGDYLILPVQLNGVFVIRLKENSTAHFICIGRRRCKTVYWKTIFDFGYKTITISGWHRRHCTILEINGFVIESFIRYIEPSDSLYGDKCTRSVTVKVPKNISLNTEVSLYFSYTEWFVFFFLSHTFVRIYVVVILQSLKSCALRNHFVLYEITIYI